MPYSIAYNSGSTTPFGTFKQGTIIMGLKPQEYTVSSGFTWYANVETPNDNYLIISDTYSQGWSTQEESKPTIWISETGTTESFVSLVNQLPDVNGVTGFTDSGNAMKYLMDSGKYFVFKDDYLGVINDNITLNLDSFWYNSFSNTGTDWYDLSGNNNHGVLVNSVGYTTEYLNVQYVTNLNYLTSYTSSSFPYLSSQAGGDVGGLTNKGNVWSESDPCSGLVTFEQALKHAHDLSCRLPTRAEVLAGAVAGTGCLYDYELIWTIDKANESGTQRWVTAGNPNLVGTEDYAGDDEIRDVTSTAYVRYVADNDINRNDPVVLTGDSIVYNYLNSNYVYETVLDDQIRSLTFDGVDDYVYLKNINYGGGKTISEMSVFIWVKTATSGSNTGDGSLDTNNWSLLDFDRSEVFNIYLEPGGQLKFGGFSSNNGNIGNEYYDVGAGTNVLFNDAEWHYVGVTFSVANQEIKFYGDGELLRTLTANGSMTPLGYGLNRYGFIGDGSEASFENGSRNNIHFQGKISSVIFYDNKVLTHSEILHNYHVTKGRFGL